ncbi:heme-degrading domain-containing protein [Dactylosporangium sp. NPDC051485]|uniref:heme-degrading domain-containing protein n=1 Tax=Dactylosporangium sp. NPDC051485 TaxID=3154846 RepID=UPI003428D033
MADLQELIGELEAQEARLVLGRFDNDDAWTLGCLLVEVAKERGLAITIDVRRGGQQLFHAALPGTAPDNDRWIERKIRVVERLHASSYLVGRRLAAKGAAFDAGYGVDPADYATHGGAFPIRVHNVGVVGVVTVSGLPQADDHALVVEVLGRFLDRVS